MNTKPSLYQQCVDAGVEIANHSSDLYIPVNDVTRKLVRESGASYTTFPNNLKNGALWYDVAFQYEPYWEAVKGKAINYGK